MAPENVSLKNVFECLLKLSVEDQDRRIEFHNIGAAKQTFPCHELLVSLSESPEGVEKTILVSVESSDNQVSH